MKPLKAIVLFLLVAIPLVTSAQETTNSPAATLSQYVAEYQANPTNKAVEEKIITLVATMTPKPEVPEEAREHFVKAMALQKDAKELTDYDLILEEYGKALAIAPWWSEAIYNRALAREAHGEYQRAVNGLRTYLLTKPDQTEARSVKDKIYALEAKLEKEQKAQAEQQQREEEIRAEQRRREQEAARQRQEEEARRAKAQDITGEWRNKDGDVIITVNRSGSSYQGRIPNEGEWKTTRVQNAQTSRYDTYYAQETLAEFWTSGTTLHFTIHRLLKQNVRDKTHWGPWITTWVMSPSEDGNSLHGTFNFHVSESAGEDKEITLYSRD